MAKKITNPMLIDVMLRHTTGIVEYFPDYGPKTGTSARRFVAEYDRAIAEAYLLGAQKVIDALTYKSYSSPGERYVAYMEGADLTQIIEDALTEEN